MSSNFVVGADDTVDAEAAAVRRISTSELAQLGVSRLAYVKPVTVDGSPAYAIHAADGTPMAVAADRDTALAAIVQHEMVPLFVH